MKKKIIFDCDPGHDDIFAILYALANPQHFDILGFCTVAGNQTLDKVSHNLNNVLTHLGISTPIHKGYDKPICKPLEVQPLAHGESGMDGPQFPSCAPNFSDQHAIEFYKEMLETHDQVTIVAIGPLTNVAIMLKTYPHLAKKIAGIACMGGSIHGGNIQLRSEFNIYHDPEAAKIMFESGVPITLAPLEVCLAGGMTFDEMEQFNQPTKVAKLVYELFEFYSRYSREHQLDSSPLFDVCPIVYLAKPDLFKGFQATVDVECNGKYTQGMTVVTANEHGNVFVLEDLNRDLFIQTFMESIFKLDRKDS